MIKKILGFLVFIICLFVIFIVEECIRLERNSSAKPLIVFKIDENIDANNLKNKKEVYTSLGYKLKKEYSATDESTEDLVFWDVVGEEFYLFDKILLWGWIK